MSPGTPVELCKPEIAHPALTEFPENTVSQSALNRIRPNLVRGAGVGVRGRGQR
jgi:hypothetical protein